MASKPRWVYDSFLPFPLPWIVPFVNKVRLIIGHENSINNDTDNSQGICRLDPPASHWKCHKGPRKRKELELAVKPLINRDYRSRSSRFFFSFSPLPSPPHHRNERKSARPRIESKLSPSCHPLVFRVSARVRLDDALEDSFPADHRMWVSFIEKGCEREIRSILLVEGGGYTPPFCWSFHARIPINGITDGGGIFNVFRGLENFPGLCSA